MISASAVSHAAKGAGTEAASFLNIPVGAEPAAMGGAFSALSANAYAPVYNPGALGQTDSSQLAAQHLAYLEAIRYEFAGFVHPLSKGRTIGASVQYLGTGNVDATDASGNSIGSITNRYGAYSIAFGQALNQIVSLGITAKIVDARLADVGATAYAVDLGSMYRLSDKFTMAAVISNIGTKMKFIEQSDSLPLAYHVGGAYRFTPQWLVSLEGVYHQAGQVSAHSGLEWSPVHELTLRAGYRTDTTKGLSTLAGLTAGVSLNMMGHSLSYAWLPMDDLGNTHYISFLFRFKQPEK